MGNRCVITTEENFENDGVGIYLHWNGGRDSVEAFLRYAKDKGHRCPEDDCYGWARLCQIIGNYFGGTTSIGIDKVSRLDLYGDNGVYLIENWEIVGRKNYGDYPEQQEYKLEDMLSEIAKRQPSEV